jgi:hypothetical protein
MPRLHAAAVSLLAAILPPAALEAPTPAFDPSAYYRLTTDFQGECKSLDIVNDASDSQPILAKSARHLSFRASSVPSHSGKFVRRAGRRYVVRANS